MSTILLDLKGNRLPEGMYIPSDLTQPLVILLTDNSNLRVFVYTEDRLETATNSSVQMRYRVYKETIPMQVNMLRGSIYG